MEEEKFCVCTNNAHREVTLEIIHQTQSWLDCKIDGVLYKLGRFRAIDRKPYYEPFLGHYVAEGWEGNGTLLVIYHHYDPETGYVDWKKANGCDWFTNCKCGKEITYALD